MANEGKRHVRDHTHDNAHPYKIKKQVEAHSQVSKDGQITILKEGKAGGTHCQQMVVLPHPSEWSDHTFNAIKFT